jgi:hypothetical protein
MKQKLNGDFFEEYMYDPGHSGYLYGVERSFSRKEVQSIERYYNIIKFELNGEDYYTASLNKIEKISTINIIFITIIKGFIL